MVDAVTDDEIFYVRGIGTILDVLNRIQDLDALVEAFARATREVFGCDRVFLLHPLDPEAATFRIPVEATTPAFPGAQAVGVDLPVTPTQVAMFSALLAADGPYFLTWEQMQPVIEETPSFRDGTIVLPKSAMITALFPRIGKPWGFGLHQCHAERQWTAVEQRLFMDIAKRLAETLSNRLLVQDLRQSREELRQTLDELMRSNRELERFAYIASHDLQEPVRTVTAFAQLLERRYGPVLDDEGRGYLRFVVSGAKRMGDLVRDLLSYSRVSSHDHQAYGPVDLNLAVRAATENLRLAIAETGAVVRCGPLPTVRGNETMLAELFQNLLSNAIKFRRPGVIPDIRIDAERGAAGWTVSVADNGIGIEPEYREQIFVIFKRLHTSEAYPGTGIGLAVCARIAEQHGGRLWVDGDVAQGSTFRFTVPETPAADPS